MVATAVHPHTQLNLEAARDGGDGAAPAPAPAASTAGRVAPGPVAAPAASPAGSPIEASLYPTDQAQWEHHEHTMAKSDHMLATSKKQLTESRLEHAMAEHDLAHNEGHKPSIKKAAAKVDKLENKLEEHTQAVQAAKDKMTEEKQEAKQAEAAAKDKMKEEKQEAKQA